MIGGLTRLAGLVGNPFRGLAADAARMHEGRALPPPRLTYLIWFMPRTSSTRLTHLLRAPGTLGAPEEWFSHGIIRRIAPELGAANREDYLDLLQRVRSQNGVFGAEVTWTQAVAVFGTTQRLMQAVTPDRLIWLIRRDMVAQAVSAVRMVQTGVTQSILATPEQRAAAEAAHHYDPTALRAALLRLAFVEARTEALLARQTTPLLRLSYEGLIAMPDAAILSHIATHLGLPTPAAPAPTAHERLAGAKSVEFALRFRNDNPRLMSWLDRTRAARLAALPSGH